MILLFWHIDIITTHSSKNLQYDLDDTWIDSYYVKFEILNNTRKCLMKY